MEVSEYEPNRCIGFRSLGGPMKLHWTVTLEPAPSGTRLYADTEAEGSGAFRLAEPLLQRAMKRQADHDFQNLKDLLETPLPVTA
jgi:carbon monoxide dehydrogenase subunit G